MVLTESQETALRRLEASGELTAAQAEAVRRELGTPEPSRPASGWLTEVAGYLGGGLMLAGAAVFLGTSWEELSREVRALVLGGTALALVAAALLVAGGPRGMRQLVNGRRRVVGVLLALTPVPAALAAGVAVTDNSATWGFVAGLVVGLACLAAAPTPLGVVVTAGMSAGAVTSAATELFEADLLGSGIALIALGAVWVAGTLAGLVRPRILGLVLGVGLAIVGAQQPIGEPDSRPWAYALTLGVAAACLALYRWNRSLVLLTGGVVGVTLAVPEAIADITNGTLSAAAILLIAGAVLLGASAAGMYLHRHQAVTAAASPR